MPEAPFVTIIVPVWNSPGLIRKCLTALHAQTYPADRRQIIVVDNASTDGTGAAVREFPSAQLLSEPKPGSYHARNSGLSVASGDYVAFTDADCIPAPDWLANGIAAAQRRPDAGVLAGYIDLFRTDDTGSEVCERYERLFAFRQDIGAKKGFCATANWISPLDVVRGAGGFEADRKSGADGELAGKIMSSGKPIVFVPDMIVRHPVRGTFEDLATKRRRLTGGRWSRTPKQGRLIRALSFVAYDTARRLRALLVAPGVGLAMRLKLGLLVIRLSSVAAAELLRLAVRGEPTRA